MYNFIHRTINLLRKPRLLKDGWRYGRKQILNISGVAVYWDGTLMDFIAAMTIDADGSPHAYKYDNTGLDDNQNAKDARGNWVGVYTRDGRPVMQRDDDPAPGYYVSTTSYQRPQYMKSDPRRYVDSEKIPFIALSPLIIKSVAATFLGCECIVSNLRKEISTPAVNADVGPRLHMGEASMKCAASLAINPNPRYGGTEDKIIKYIIKPGSPATINGEKFELQKYA